MAAKIKDKTPVREIFAQQLVERGVMSQEESDAIQKEIWDGMAERHRELKEELSHASAEQPTGGYQLDRSPSPEVKTAVSADRLPGSTRTCCGCPRASTSTRSCSSSSSAGATRSAPTAASTGRTPRRSRSPRC